MSLPIYRQSSRTLDLDNIGPEHFLGVGDWKIVRPDGTIVALHVDTFLSPPTNWNVKRTGASPPYTPVRVYVPATNGIRDGAAAPSGEYEVHWRGEFIEDENLFEAWRQKFSVPSADMTGPPPPPCPP